MDRIRSHVGPHRILVWLGRGGDAEVWAAEEALTGARIAIKSMRGEQSGGRVGRLVREYQFLRLLADAGVTRVPRARSLGVDEEGRMFLAMDLVDGVAVPSWHDRVAGQVKDDPARLLPRVQAVLVDAAEVLASVHAAGLVHGDVKSSCFMVGARDEVSLIDFGGSRPIEASALTREIEESFGTASYSSIEALNKATPTVEADIWSFATTAFRLMTGEHPAGHGTRALLRARWAEVTPEALAAKLLATAPTLPTRARELIVQCFAHDPKARPTLPALAEAMREGALAEPPPPEPFVRHEAADGEGGGAELAERITTLLAIAGEPLAPRVLARAVGRSTRRVLATLVHMNNVERADSLAWRLTRAAAANDAEAADALATVLADEPIGAARVRALAAGGHDDEAIAAAERWVTVLTAQGRLAEAVPVVRTLSQALSPRLGLLQAKVELAATALPPGLDERLEAIAARDALAASGLGKARWALARHFGSFHVSATPAALGVAWRAFVLGEIDAALTSAEAALEEARWLRQPEAEADALSLLARIYGLRGRTRAARRFAAEAVDRWPARAPGIGEALATLAHLSAQSGAASEARRLVSERAPDMPTPVDRAHLLVALAEIEQPFDHPAVVNDALAVVERIFFQAQRVPALEARIAALRASDPEGAVSAQALLHQLTAERLPLHVPMLGAAAAEGLAVSDRAAAEDALAIADDAATFMNDVPGRLRVATARATCAHVWGEAFEEDAELTLTAVEAELWPGLVAFERARQVPLAAWSAARRFLSDLDVADANALRLMPWAVAARAEEARAERAARA